MSNLPSSFSNAGMPANPQQLANTLMQPFGGESTPSVFGDFLLLKMHKDSGQWTTGQENIKLPEKTSIVINPHSFQQGWICWHNKQPVGEVMVPVVAAMPPAPGSSYSFRKDISVPENPEWKVQLSFEAELLGVKREKLIYKISSLGGKEAINRLAQAIGLRAGSGEPAYVPVIQLQHTTYPNSSGGTTYKPVFNILEWLSLSSDEGVYESADEIAVDDETQAVDETPPERTATKTRTRTRTAQQ